MPKDLKPLKISPNTPADLQKMLTDVQAAYADGKITLAEVWNLGMDLLTLYRDMQS